MISAESSQYLLVGGRDIELVADGYHRDPPHEDRLTCEAALALAAPRQRIADAGADWRETADESADNGIDSLYLWRLADRLYLIIYCEQGRPVNANLSDDDLADYVCAYCADGCRESEALASWGLDGLAAETEAAEDYDGECAIWCEPHYYEGTCGAPQAGFVRDDKSLDIRVFPRVAEAQAYVDEYYSAPSGYDGIRECNVLSHGQFGADTLTIVEWH